MILYLTKKAHSLLDEKIFEKAVAHNLFYQCGYNGDIELITYFAQSDPDKTHIIITPETARSCLNGALSNYAPQQKHVPIVKYFIEELPKKNSSLNCTEMGLFSFNIANIHNHLDTISYLTLESPEIIQKLFTSSYIKEINKSDDKNLTHVTRVLKYCGLTNNRALAQHYLENHTSLFTTNNLHPCLYEAGSAGSLDVIEYILAKSPEKIQSLITINDLETSLKCASLKGHYEVIGCLIEKCPYHMLNNIDTHALLSALANSKTIDIFNYLFEFTQTIATEGIHESFINQLLIASTRNFKIFQFFLTESPTKFLKLINRKGIAEAVSRAALESRPESLNYLLNTGPEWIRNFDVVTTVDNILTESRYDKRESLIKKHLEKYRDNNKKENIY